MYDVGCFIKPNDPRFENVLCARFAIPMCFQRISTQQTSLKLVVHSYNRFLGKAEWK